MIKRWSPGLAIGLVVLFAGWWLAGPTDTVTALVGPASTDSADHPASREKPAAAAPRDFTVEPAPRRLSSDDDFLPAPYAPLFDADSATIKAWMSAERDQAAYRAGLVALSHFVSEKGQRREDWWNVQATPGALWLHEPEAADIAMPLSGLPALPATILARLELPDHYYTDHVIVRWVDASRGRVLGLQRVQTNHLGGSQLFTTRPPEAVEEGYYRLEVYDPADAFQRVAAISMAVGPNNHTTARKRHGQM